MGTHKHYGQSNPVDLKSGWQAFTPTISGGATKGNGTTTGAYRNIAGMVDFYLVFTLGSTSTVTGSSVAFNLPVAPLSNTAYTNLSAVITDAGTGNFLGLSVLSGSTVQMWNYATSGPVASFAAVSSTAPMTWAANDVIEVRGSYRAA